MVGTSFLPHSCYFPVMASKGGWSREELQELCGDEPHANEPTARYRASRTLGTVPPLMCHFFMPEGALGALATGLCFPETRLSFQGSRGILGADGAEGKPGTQVPILPSVLDSGRGLGWWVVSRGDAEQGKTLPPCETLL